ncbi:RsfA family transcriptional regulator [Bacillus massiliigorillae]|uniref:RsfA family transcriptional regulator n=1 Tax=Bacillus massiliigorillae TaxID=1243664 RepID=UPI0003AB1DDB|nr:RsfA family transcriptional regulator [Bacillus massiliigorillae]
MKVRQDAWTEEDDLLLAETVLRHVREGSTQLNAFEEVGDKLNRTSAACGFRWNAVVRHNYEKALQLAKKQRKQRNRLLGKEQGGKKKLLYTPPTPSIVDVGLNVELIPEPLELQTNDYQEEISEPIVLPNYEVVQPTNTTNISSIDDVISFLQSMNTQSLHSEVLKAENERLKAELRDAKNEIFRMKQHNEELQGKIDNLAENSETIQEDYETMMKIMNRARKLVLLEEEVPHTTKFKMDRNGNLEKVAE